MKRYLLSKLMAGLVLVLVTSICEAVQPQPDRGGSVKDQIGRTGSADRQGPGPTDWSNPKPMDEGSRDTYTDISSYFIGRIWRAKILKRNLKHQIDEEKKKKRGDRDYYNINKWQEEWDKLDKEEKDLWDKLDNGSDKLKKDVKKSLDSYSDSDSKTFSKGKPKVDTSDPRKTSKKAGKDKKGEKGKTDKSGKSDKKDTSKKSGSYSTKGGVTP